MEDLSRIVDEAMADFAACADSVALENAKARYLGKAGALTTQLKSLGKLPATERATSRPSSPPMRSTCRCLAAGAMLAACIR
jgi:phenylalanyl-tRNA synthetase alpha subunit